MKKTILYALTLAVSIICVNAQETIVKNGYIANIDSINTLHYGNLNTSYITTGLLSDRAFYICEPEKYTGNPTTDTLANADLWLQIYAAMYNSQLTGVNLLLNPQDVFNTLEQYRKSDIIPITILNMSYNSIKENAISDNLLYMDNDRLFDVSTRTVTPYATNRVFVASPCISRSNNSEIKYTIKPELVYSNVSQAIRDVYIDFGDGNGFQNVLFNSVITVNYTTGGIKNITVKVIYSDSSEYYSSSTIDVSILTIVRVLNSTNTAPQEDWIIQGIRSYNGTASGKAHVIYGCGNQKIRKPIIITDGFDPLNLFNFEDILDAIPENNSIPNDINDLIAKGYDVIALDYDDGGTYIQQNAFVLEALINKINQVKEGDEGIVLIGPSMGGLIARYTLSYMEKNNPETNHNVKLYVSLDGSSSYNLLL